MINESETRHLAVIVALAQIYEEEGSRMTARELEEIMAKRLFLSNVKLFDSFKYMIKENKAFLTEERREDVTTKSDL